MPGGTFAKAYLKPEGGPQIDCLFNPAELTISKSTEWSPARAKGKNAPKLRFQQGQSGSMTMTLTLDTTASGESVTKHTDALLGLTRASRKGDSGNNSARPPWCEFHWGSVHSFKAVVESLQIRFTYFSFEGVPLRAQASLTLKQYQDQTDWPPGNPTSGTPEPHAIHHVQPGETLDRIAAVHYGDPTRWRVLAESNGILDPLALEPGTVLAVPSSPGVSRG